MTSSSQLRSTFLDYFAARGHRIMPSASLVPGKDPTLLFTNAGMVPFKDVFLGREAAPGPRATSSQRCVRAGGKHNDLENVGYTARHHTFFEMLGNFSFGDYFKREAIGFAWELLTKELSLPADRLWVTVYEEDSEAERIWLKDVGVSSERFSRIGAKDNFWSMGDTGPCGPCTEIFYDHGPHIAGGPPGSPGEDGDRYIEIWNLVFMQYDRGPDGTLVPLPKPSVDTGMGLERLAAVMQGVHNNYDTDLFVPLIDAAASLAGRADRQDASLRVIADHIRSITFLIADGVMPSNEGRGYVLRRIIRRAARHGHRLGLKETFLHRLIEPLAGVMGGAYPELVQRQDSVVGALRHEEERFAETLEQGMSLLEGALQKLSGNVIPGDTVFKLYDTYGFPVDLTADIARERKLSLDMEGFEREMESQRERGRAASQFSAAYVPASDSSLSSDFLGYEQLAAEGRVTALYKDGVPVQALEAGQDGAVVLDRTAFYAESGGQVGDHGELQAQGVRFEVEDTQKLGKAHLHIGRLHQGRLELGQTLHSQVDAARRQAVVLNHSATHLLHAALREVLGPHVQQKGSLVAPERLRFDFSHPSPVTADQLRAIEHRVNEQVRLNAEAQTRQMELEQALQSGAMALFGEKYDAQVRVLQIGPFSTELCGGTHVKRAGDIGLFKILSEGGVASGVRRIEAVTGLAALQQVEEVEQRLTGVAQLFKAGPQDVIGKAKTTLDRIRTLERELDQLKAKIAKDSGGDLAGQAVDVSGVKVLAARLEQADTKVLRDTLDQLKDKLGSAAIVLASVAGGKVSLVAGVTKDQTAKVKAGELVNSVAVQVGGKGGGRPDMAQAGGDDPTALDTALKSVPEWVRAKLA